MPPDYSRYQYDPSLLTEFYNSAKPALLDFVKQRGRHGGETQHGVEDMYSRLAAGKLKAYGLPDELYEQERGDVNLTGGSGGFHRGDEIFTKGTGGGRGIAHEFGHELYGHKAGERGVPELNPYQKLDRKLKGWLPSFSKYGERPNIMPIKDRGGYSSFDNRQEYNQRMREGEYNPQFADAPFEVLEEAMWNLQNKGTKDALLSNVLGTVKTGGGDYSKYDPRSLKAKDFRGAFGDARRAGLKEFDWDGRKYSSELA